MTYLPVKTPSAVETFSIFVAYRQSAALNTTGTTVLLTADDNMGMFVPTEIYFHVDANSDDLKTFTMSIGWNGAYNNIVASVVQGTTQTTSTFNYLRLKPNRFFKLPLTSSGTGYATYATTANTATAIRLNISATTMPVGATGTFFVVGYYTGMRP